MVSNLRHQEPGPARRGFLKLFTPAIRFERIRIFENPFATEHESRPTELQHPSANLTLAIELAREQSA